MNKWSKSRTFFFIAWLSSADDLFLSDALLKERVVIEKMFNYSCLFFKSDFAEKWLSLVLQDIDTV